MTKKTCKRPKGEKSHCIMSASSLKALETMINSYYFSKNYIITEDMTVYNTVTDKTLDSVYVKVTPAGRYQCRKIDVFGESKEPEKAEQKHDSEFSGSLLDGQLKNHLEESRKEESRPTETEPKGESTMNENTNTAVQEVQEAQEAEKTYTVEQVRQITGLNSSSVCITAHTFADYAGGLYQAFRAAFIAGVTYKIPDKYIKSAAAEIVFRVVSNSGKSIKVNIYEKYNGKITEQTGKTKKLCPGGHGYWLLFNPETKKFAKDWQTNEKEGKIEFVQVDTVDLSNVSRWTSGNVACYECTPMTEAEFDNWRQNPGTDATPTATAAKKNPDELNFTPLFYPVSEELARQHKNMISWSDYKPGTVTQEYKEAVKHAYELARVSSDHEKSLYLAECYSRRLARWYDDYNRNGAACPSVMISGAGNFPTRKKEKQNARFDTLMHQYDKIKHLLDKIEKPHGYGVEIRRDTITAEEFENILYFETIINEEENRLQLIFDGKPEEEERNILKRNGFRWSPRFKAWQRQLTENAVAAVWKVVSAFDALEDAENAEIQEETEEIKAATPEGKRTETVETTEAEQEAQPEEIPKESAQAETTETEAAAEAEKETAKSNNIDLSPLPFLTGENIPCFVPDSYLGLYSTAQALAANLANPENEKYFREQISRILKKYIADAENIIAVYGAEALEIFEYAEIFNSFIYGELSEEISTAEKKGLKIFAEYHTEPEQEESAQSETIPTEADTSPTGSPEQSAPETIPTNEESANSNVFGGITGNAEETEAPSDWNGVKFEPIPGIPDPETVGAEFCDNSSKLTEALEKLDRMRHKLDKSTYTSTGNSRYYNGFWSAVCCIFGEVLYDTETGKHYLQAVSEAAAQAEAEENSVETAQTAETESTAAEPEKAEQAADETIKFEPGKIYSAIHITNSDYISAYKVISRTAKTIILENSSGERFRKRPTVTDGYINGKQCHCETVYPDGVYSMCLVLRATDTVEAETPKQAETEYHTAQQAQTAAAVSAARQQRIIQTAGGKITMTVNGAAQ